MEIDRALNQIEQIHDHLARGEVVRDWRWGPVSLTGVLALAAGALQSVLIGPEPTGSAFLVYWLGLAALAALVGGAAVVKSYLAQPSAWARRQTRIVLAQFAPTVAVATLLTVSFAGAGAAGIGRLPALWALVMGLGTFAARPYLPRAIGWAGLYYLLAGGLLLAFADRSFAFLGWGMALAFGPPQILAGLVFHWNLERHGGPRA